MGNPLAPRLGIGVAACAALLLGTDPAAAAGRVLVEPGSALGVAEARIAQALAPSWTTVWLSVRASEPGRFALLLPVPAGTAIDPALGDWLEALDQATAPRVLPPAGAPLCGSTTGASSDGTALGHLSSAPAKSVAVLVDANDAPSYAASQGFAFTAEDATALATTSGSRLVAIVFEPKSASEVTQTLRLGMPVASSALKLRLLDSSPLVEELTLFTFAEGRASTVGADELEKAEVTVTWKAFDAESDYVEARRALLEEKQGGGWLIESTSTASLYGWSVLPNGAGAIPPAVQTYFEQAQKHGASVPNTTACLDKVWDARTDGQLTGARVSRACPPGLLAAVPWGSVAPPCDETPAAGESPSAALRCGEADDLAYALSGLRADKARLTRQSGVVATKTPPITNTGIVSGSDVSPVVTASEIDEKGCLTGNGSGGAGGAGGGGWGQGGSDGLGASGGWSGDPGSYEEEPDPHADVQCGCTAQDSESCSRDSSGGEDDTESCGGDGSAEEEGDSCSGDSSDGTAEEGETCAGDSSDGSEEGAETCSGDSSSDAEGDTCSGSSSDSGSSGGDSCGSGSSSGSGSGDCTLGRGRRPRLRLSILTLLLAAVALPLRRLGRRRRNRT